jgi:hypothetical protein
MAIDLLRTGFRVYEIYKKANRLSREFWGILGNVKPI